MSYDVAAAEAAEVGIHDSVYNRGHEAGYVTAMIESRTDFARDVVARNAMGLIDLITPDAVVHASPRGKRKYGIEWYRLEVTFT